MDFVLRADADPRIGSGHVMRCLALAEALLARGHVCHFAAASLPPGLAARLQAAGLVVHRLEPSADCDGTATCRLIADTGAAGAIIDGYHFGRDWRRCVAATGAAVLALSDDAADIPDGARLVLNAAAAPAADPPGIRLLYGAGYVLLRREFNAAARLPPLPIAERRSILVTFGGSDPAGLTLPVARALGSAIAPPTAIDIVIGGGVADAAGLAGALATLGPQFRPHVDAANMAVLMRRAGLAISAAGSTVGELAAMGVPAILVAVAENQVVGATGAAGAGWCDAIIDDSPEMARRLAARAAALWRDCGRREAMAARARETVTLDGAERAVDALLREIGRAAQG